MTRHRQTHAAKNKCTDKLIMRLFSIFYMLHPLEIWKCIFLLLSLITAFNMGKREENFEISTTLRNAVWRKMRFPGPFLLGYSLSLTKSSTIVMRLIAD